MSKKLRIFCPGSLRCGTVVSCKLSAHAGSVRVSGSNEAFSPEKSRSIQSAAGPWRRPAGRWCSDGRVDQRHRVAERKRDVEVVRREEDALALVAGQPPEQRRQLVAVRQVEEGGGFVEQDDGGVLRPARGRSSPAGIRRRTCGPSSCGRKPTCPPAGASVRRRRGRPPACARSSWCRGRVPAPRRPRRRGWRCGPCRW